MSQDLKRTNEVKIAGVLSEQQVTATFKKQVILVNAKDTKDNQWKQAEMEIYIKPDLLAQTGAAVGDTILITGWLAFNFWNGRSFPRIVATEVQLIEKAGAQAQGGPAAAPAQAQAPQNFNSPQYAGQVTGAQPVGVPGAPVGGPQVPGVPGVPPVPGAPA